MAESFDKIERSEPRPGIACQDEGLSFYELSKAKSGDLTIANLSLPLSTMLGKENSLPRPIQILQHAAEAFAYTGMQAPAQSLSQFISQDAQKAVTFMQAPLGASFGSTDWLAQQLGSTAGMIIPLMALHRGSSKLIESRFLKEGSVLYAASCAKQRTLINELKLGALQTSKSALAGLAYGGLLTPLEPGENFYTGKARTMIVASLTFGTLGATSYGLRSIEAPLAKSAPFLSKIVGNPALVGAISGLAAGLVSADTESILSGNGFANGTDRWHSMASMSLLGGSMGEAQRRFFVEPGKKTSSDSFEKNNQGKVPEAQSKYLSDTITADGARLIVHHDGTAVRIENGKARVIRANIERPKLVDLKVAKEVKAEKPAIPKAPEPNYDHLPPEQRPLNIGAQGAESIAEKMSNFEHAPFTLDGEYSISTNNGPQITFKFNNESFESVEGLYVYLKHSGSESKQAIARTLSSYEAKRFGKSGQATATDFGARHFELGSNEHHAAIKLGIKAKLEHHPELAQQFAQTAPRPIIHDLGRPENPKTKLPAADFARILTELRQDIIDGNLRFPKPHSANPNTK